MCQCGYLGQWFLIFNFKLSENGVCFIKKLCSVLHDTGDEMSTAQLSYVVSECSTHFRDCERQTPPILGEHRI